MLLYRFLIAAATLAALITFWADWQQKKFSFLPKYTLGCGLLILAAGFTFLEHLESKKKTDADYSALSSSQGGKGNINISGSDVKGVSWSSIQTEKIPRIDNKDTPMLSSVDLSAKDGAQGGFGNLNIKDSRVEIHQGDSPEVRERKIEIAKQSVADSIYSNLSAIDARLSYIKTALRNDTFEAELNAINEKLTPSAAKHLTGGYRQLVNQERISSLRLTMNTRPLKQGIDNILLNTLREAHIDESSLKSFFDEQMPEVDGATEMLYRVLAEPGFVAPNPSPEERAYAIRRLALQRESLEIQSTYALLYGIDVLRVLNRMPDEVNSRLQALQNLTPRNLLTETEIANLFNQTANRQKQLLTEKMSLESEALKLLNEGASSLIELNKLLEIQPTDTWQEVFGKARSLRDFGRIAEAVQAFDKYGQMFKKADPTAVRYSETAKAFTQSIEKLGIKGGCYVFEVRAGGPEAKAGLQVGDILIELAGSPIPGMVELTKIYSDIKGTTAPLRLLRLNRTTSQFEPVMTIIEIGAILRGVMPI